jgi:hypothetical protein
LFLRASNAVSRAVSVKLHLVKAAGKDEELDLQIHCRAKLKEVIYLFMLAIPGHDDDGDGEGADGVGNGEDPEPLHWIILLPPHRVLQSLVASSGILAQKPDCNWH